jgi:Mrp family chromosome partitioning ATPase/predicted Fe-Mo cluster-binding NifX family protein
MTGCSEKTCGDAGAREAEQMIQDAEIRDRLGRIKNKLVVMSGKGGVGKSSVSACLAVTLAQRGYRVGLMDVDLHGPSIPRLLGLKGFPQPSNANKILPINYQPNLQVMSIEILLQDRDAATIWRGPLKIGVIRQFISDVEWDNLDYLVVDSPPGTGDEPLTVAQTINDAKAIIVTTPQEISLADVRKSINFCRQVNLEMLGLVENMSGLVCPHCGETIDIFKQGGGLLTAKAMDIPFLGALPIEPLLVQEGDRGSMVLLNDGTLKYTQKFNALVDRIIELAPVSRQVEEERNDHQGDDEMNGRTVFAIPLAQGSLCNHFGHCEQFALIQVEEGKIVDKQLLTPPPHEPGLLPRWLSEKGATVIIAGGMGVRAQDLFAEQRIEVVVGAPVAGPEELVHQYLSRSLATGPNVCDHEHHKC